MTTNLRNLAEQAWFITRHMLYCILALTGIAVFTYYAEQAWANGKVAELAPKPNIVEPPPPPLPQTPIKIVLNGPEPRYVVQGVSTILMADIAGPASTPEWEVLPEDMGVITPFGDGKQAKLITSGEGECTVIAIIASNYTTGNNRAERAKFKLTSIPQVVEQPRREPVVDDTPPPAPQPMPIQPAQTVTISQQTLADLAHVNDPQRPQHAVALGGTINTVAGRISGGYIAPNALSLESVIAEVRRSAQFKLQADYALWDAFFNAMAKNLRDLQAGGAVFDKMTLIRALNEIASVLLADR